MIAAVDDADEDGDYEDDDDDDDRTYQYDEGVSWDI